MSLVTFVEDFQMLARVRLLISSQRRPAPLRSHLVVLVLLATLPLFSFSVFMIYRAAQEERASFRRGATERTRAILTAVDTELKSSIARLESLATSRKLDTEDLPGIYDDMTRVLKSQPDWFTVPKWT